MTYLRIATAQLGYRPVTRTSEGVWMLDEPLVPNNPFVETKYPEYLLSSLRGKHKYCRDVCERLMKESRQNYISNLTEKLREIMTFCFRNEVDVVLLPEYSVPINSVESLRSFSNRMAIVAGLGYLQRSDIESLRGLDIDVRGIGPANNVAVVLSPEKNFLVAKKNQAETEHIVSGNGPVIEKIELPKGSFTIGVAICLDFVREKGLFHQKTPDIVFVPALSKNTEEFTDETPRDFVRVFANHALFGGSYIGAPMIKGMNFTNMNGTIPLKREVEGIVIVDWDFENAWPTKPTSTRSVNHRLYARSAIIYKGNDEDISSQVSIIGEKLSRDLRIDDFIEYYTHIRQFINESKNSLLVESVDTLEDRSEILDQEELNSLIRHCVLSSNVFSLYDWQYRQCIVVAERLKRLQDSIPDIVSAPYGEYEKIAREIAKFVRTNLLVIRHKGPTVDVEDANSDKPQYVLYATLGAYSDVTTSLPRQLTLLRTLADIHDPSLQLKYRLRTIRDESGIIQAMYEVICTTKGRDQEEIEQLRQGFGQLIHITFAGIYSINYTTDEKHFKKGVVDVRESFPWWLEIVRNTAQIDGKVVSRRVTDWGLVVDLLRSLDMLTILDLECKALSSLTEPAEEGEIEEGSSSEPPTSSKDRYSSTFSELFSEGKDDSRRLSVRVFIGGSEPLPSEIVSAIGAEIYGSGRFIITTSSSEITDDVSGVSPVEALSIFHPPYGAIYRTAGLGRYNFRETTDETRFPPTGILLGKAITRQVRSDEDIEVRIADVDRLRHVYVVGKTGTGKTNLLKIMASQDVQIPGRGVTIIDPHGDLVDHVLREIPDGRAKEVTLIDLSRTDSLPILNPLDIDKDNITVRDRTIQELISLLHSRVYHQYTGPRFDELARLALQTMLDKGYPVPPSFIEVSRLFMDEKVQEKVVKSLQEEELRRRWEFQREIKRDPEFGGLIHWITSKFDDMSRDFTLRCVLGGSKSTVDIEDVVQKGEILLVRIPEAVIGKQAADFIGSLILLQLRMAIIRRREFDKFQHYHFVYVDEFQNFANTDFHTLVAEARKFNIGFTLANQNLEQLREFRSYTGFHEQRLINAILGNVANIIAFGVGVFDAEILSTHFHIHQEDILRIGRFEAIAKILVNGHDTKSFTIKTGEATRLESPRNVEIVENRMKSGYWIDRQEVLREISTRFDGITETEKPKKPNRIFRPNINVEKDEIFRNHRNNDNE